MTQRNIYRDGKAMNEDEYHLEMCRDLCTFGDITLDTSLEVRQLLATDGKGEIAAENLLINRHDLSYGDMRAVIRYLKSTVGE